MKRNITVKARTSLGAFAPILEGSIHRFLATYFNHLSDAILGDLADVKCDFGEVGDLPSEWPASVVHCLRRVLALIFRRADSYSFVPWRLAAERGADFHI